MIPASRRARDVAAGQRASTAGDRRGPRSAVVRHQVLRALSVAALACGTTGAVAAQVVDWSARAYARIPSDSRPGGDLLGQTPPDAASWPLAVTPDGKVYVTGEGWTGESHSFLTVAYDTDGSELWTRVRPGDPLRDVTENSALAVAVGDGGTVYATGWIGVVDPRNTSFLTVAYDAEGQELWSRTKRWGDYSYATTTAVGPAGTLYVSGIACGAYAGTSGCFFLTVEYDGEGNELWSRLETSTTARGDLAMLRFDSTGNFYVAGNSHNGSDSDFLVVSYDGVGNLRWVRTRDGAGHGWDEAEAMVVGAMDRLYLVGRSQESSSSESVTVAYDSDGNELWMRVHDVPSHQGDQAEAVAVDAAGNVYVTGPADQTGNILTVSYDAAGNQRWYRVRAGGYQSHAVTVSDSGVVYVAGHDAARHWLTIAYDSDGTELWERMDDVTAVPYALGTDAAGNAYVTGWTDFGGHYAYQTIAYDPQGNELWRQVGPQAMAEDDRPGGERALALDAAGNSYVTGFGCLGTDGHCEETAFLTVKYDREGRELWNRSRRGASGYAAAEAAAADVSGSVVVTGSAGSPPSVALDYLTVAYDGAGEELWARTKNGVGGGNDVAHAVARDGSGNVYVTGRSRGATGDDFLTVAYDAAGTELWARTKNGSGQGADEAHVVAVDGSGRVIVAGTTYYDSVSSPYGYLTVAYDSAGNELWARTLVTGATSAPSPPALAVDALGRVFLVGTAWNGADDDLVIAAYSSAGDELWTRTKDVDSGSSESAVAVSVDGTGSIYLVGNTRTGNDFDAVIAAYDHVGDELWIRTKDGPAHGADYAKSLAVDGTGRVYVAISTGDGSSWDYLTVAYDSAGNEVWELSVDGGYQSSGPRALRVDDRGGVILTGASTTEEEYRSEYGTNDFLTLRIRESLPPSLPTSIEPLAPHVPGAWSNQAEIIMEWSGAADELGGSGLAGYSVEWTSSPEESPDETVDVIQATDPHSFVASPGEGTWYFHLRVCDRAGIEANCSDAAHVGPFGIDTVPPSAPGAVGSPSHGDGAPRSDPTIDLAWGAATDSLSGVDGYGLSLDGNASSACETTKDVEEGTLSVTTPPLADGIWYAHVCVVDEAGNWGPVVHGGPYVVDATPPALPASVTSPTHGGGPSQAETIEVEWTPAADNVAGVAGYGWSFSSMPSWTCDQVADGDEIVLATSSMPLAEGDWYVHLCVVDRAGNWSAAGTWGPWIVDRTAPRVAEADSVPEAGVDGIAVPEVRAALTELLVGFDEGMAESGAGSVTDPDNWRLVEAGANGTLESPDCGPTGGDDLLTTIASIAYEAELSVAAVTVGEGAGLSPGIYRLIACPTLADPAGNELDGGFSAPLSTPWSMDLSVVTSPLARNPNFDGSASFWLPSGPVASEWSYLEEDCEGKPLSGAMRLDTAAGDGATWYLEQCVELPESELFTFSSLARVGSSVVGSPTVRVALIWADAPGCGGVWTQVGTSNVLSSDTAGDWVGLGIPEVSAPPEAQSVRISFVVAGGAASEYTVDLDRVFLAPLSAWIFDDDFESGGACEWDRVLGGPLCP